MNAASGFSRLRGLAAAGAIGIAGLAGGNVARAASATLPLNVTRGAAAWTNIDNNSNFPSSGTVTTTNGDVYASKVDAFGIRDANLSDGASGSFGDAFDNALILSVDGNLFTNPDTTVDLTGDTVTSDTVAIVPGIDAQVRYTFFPGRPVARGLFSLTNTSGAPITVDAAILGDYGSDSSTAVRATSDGDTTIEATDFWYMTDDLGNPKGSGDALVNPRKVNSPNGTGDPRITMTRYGAGAAVVPFNALTPGSGGPDTATTGLRYPVTIAAGQTARILVFAEMSDPNIPEAAAVAAAASFESIDALQAAGLLSGISATELGEVINYGQGTQPPAGTTVELPSNTPAGLAALLAALGGLAFLELRRRRKHGTA